MIALANPHPFRPERVTGQPGCTCGNLMDLDCIYADHREWAVQERIEHPGIEGYVKQAIEHTCRRFGMTLKGQRLVPREAA